MEKGIAGVLGHLAAALVIIAQPISACAADVIALPSTGDRSGRCSVVDPVVIATWETDSTEGFRCEADPKAIMKLRASSPGWAAYQGKRALRVKFTPGAEASQWRAVTRRFDTPLDLTGRNIVEYGILADEGPGRDMVTRMTLIAPDGRRHESLSHIIPSLWRSVMFDVSSCPFLSEVSAIEIAVANEGMQPWMTPFILLDGLQAGRPLDLDFNVAGSEQQLIPSKKGRVAMHSPGQAEVVLPKDGWVETRFPTSHNSIYNPDLERRNTVRLVMANSGPAAQLRLWFTTDNDSLFTLSKSKTVNLSGSTDLEVIEVNLSDLPTAKGRVTGLRLEPIGGRNALTIDRISFEREAPIRPNAGSISSCTADSATLTVKGLITTAIPDGTTIELRHSPLWRTEEPFDSLELLATVAAAPEFTISGVTNSRLDGRMTHLSSRLEAALRLPDGSLTPIGRPFFIENWRDFSSNPYAFNIADVTYRATDFGARGNGVVNDNAAIQQAINRAAALGGGRVVLTGSGNPLRPATYLATNLRLLSGVELVIEPTAVLRQSPVLDHYTADYRPEYGHDNVIPGIPWTHCMYTNMPLILAKDADHVKITGGGTIRMDDTWSENPAWLHYARNCSDRIHLVPIAVCNTSHVEITDIDILRSSNYHTIFYRADSVMIGNLKMLEVACLSGDGLSFGNAVTNVKADRCVFESNDDGIVLCSSYKDPRGGGWRIRVDSIDSSVRHIEVLHSYIDSRRGGGGKAIALIPWGSTNPRQDYNEIDDIHVSDCVLRGGASVGAWPDNPFDGKPFDNNERDDYAPVKNLRIVNNEYLSPCELFWVVPTSLYTDCPLHSSSAIKNGDFADRLAYWTVSGNVEAEKPGAVNLGSEGAVTEGLWLAPGRYLLATEGTGAMQPVVDGASVAEYADPALLPLVFEVTSEGYVTVGVKVADGDGATLRAVMLESLTDESTKQ